jgi:hypothetical protein
MAAVALLLLALLASSSPASALPLTLVVDCSGIGDRYEILVNNSPYITTSATAPADDGVPSGAFTGPASWADSRLSKVSFVLAAGTWDIDINVIDTALSLTTGEGFIQVLTFIPEPDALLLLAVGLAGLLWMSTPKRQESARPSPPKR